jgi:hypothetical protein
MSLHSNFTNSLLREGALLAGQTANPLQITKVTVAPPIATMGPDEEQEK